MNAILDFLRKLFGLDSPTPPADPADPCNAPPCIDAKSRLAGARGRFNSACNGLRMLKAVEKLLRQILSTPIWIIVVLAVIAAIIGGPIAVIIWALIAVYGISWLLLFVVAKMAASFAASLVQAQADVAAALKEVVANCPERCRGDLSIPSCQLE